MLKISGELQLPIDAVTGTFGILATKGAGKSNAAVVMGEEMYDAGVPWVAIDPKGDWWGVRSSADGKGPGLPIVVFGGRHGDVPLEPTAGALLADLVLEQRLTCVLDVSQFTKADVVRFLLAFGTHLFRHADDAEVVEPLHLFLEEAHEYLPQQVSSRTDGGDIGKLVGAWQRIVKQGRFKGLGVTMISQRSSSLNKDVLELVDTLIVLRTIGPRSRDAIKQWVKDQDVDEKLLASLPTLTSGEAWIWSPGELDILKRVHFRRRRTFDSGATPKVGQARRAPATLADVDLAAIKEQMADTIEKAKADDPKLLRKRITELERDLTAARAEKPEPIVDRVEVPVLSGEAVEALRGASGALSLTRDVLDAAMKQFATPGVPRATSPSGTQRGSTRRTEPAPKAEKPQVKATPRRDTPADTDLPKGERLVLTAVAQHTDGVTREQITILTAYKRSTRDTYVQRLRERGCVEVTGNTIRATDIGIDMLGDDFEPLPTGEALREHWLINLPEGERKILAELVDAYPGCLSREELSERTDYKRSTRDTYIQRLRVRQLVVIDDGEPRASAMLFEDFS